MGAAAQGRYKNGQTLDAQQAQLAAAGAEKVFSEKESGAKPNRKALAKALAALKSGDMLLVTRLDRLARSTLDLLNTFCSGPEDGGDSSQDPPRGGRLNPVVVVNDRDADHHVGRPVLDR